MSGGAAGARLGHVELAWLRDQVEVGRQLAPEPARASGSGAARRECGAAFARNRG